MDWSRSDTRRTTDHLNLEGGQFQNMLQSVRLLKANGFTQRLRGFHLRICPSATSNESPTSTRTTHMSRGLEVATGAGTARFGGTGAGSSPGGALAARLNRTAKSAA